ncbi:MAG: hypothetical protein J0L62_08395 [Bacteroidetes bacterium]|nr:hypothetical protein [Bacteroidota bacterium]
MLPKTILASLTSFLFLLGCTPSVMSLKPEETKNIEPIGLYIIASSQLEDNNDYLHKDFTISTASIFIPKFFKFKGYEMKLLNPGLPTDRVFEKKFGTFNIDEKIIAQFARKENCSTFLIVYYAYTGDQQSLIDGLNMYSNCSLYGWLINSKDAGLISSSHSVLSSINTNYGGLPFGIPPGINKKDYQNFLENIAMEMFKPFPSKPK